MPRNHRRNQSPVAGIGQELGRGTIRFVWITYNDNGSSNVTPLTDYRPLRRDDFVYMKKVIDRVRAGLANG